MTTLPALPAIPAPGSRPRPRPRTMARAAAPARPRIAIAHDYLTQRGGAERVVLAMVRAFPDAVVHTSLYDPEGTYPEFKDVTIVASPLNRVGAIRRNHRLGLPFFALAAAATPIDADVVITSSSGWAHGFRSSGRRLVYCYSPARWLYQTDTYLGRPARRSPQGWALLALRPALRWWDKRAASRAEEYVAISSVVQDRIRDTYGRDAQIVPAPHSMDADAAQSPVAELADWAEDGYHLVVSRLLPYKNVREAVEAFRVLPERLVVVGRGPLLDQIVASAPDNVRVVSDLDDAQVRWVYGHARALVAPSHEDYGLTPLEAGMFGVPCLALRGGGYLDTILEDVTGQFFDAPTPGAIRAAVVANRDHRWDADKIRSHAEHFSVDDFAAELVRRAELLLHGSRAA